MSDWEYSCRVAADGTSEQLVSAPEFPAKERNACVAPAADGDGSGPTLLNALPDGSGAVLLVFMGNDFPAIDDIEAKMAGFDTWGILTAERPFIEMSGPRAIPTFEFNTPGWESTAELLGTVAQDGGGQWGGAGSGALINSGWPFFYRALAVRTPPAASESLAEILAGAGIVPRGPDGGGPFAPAASRAEMTFRHLRGGGDAPALGSDRISMGKDYKSIYKIAETAPVERPIVRIDPGILQKEGAQFLHPSELLQDLDIMQRQFEREWEALKNAGAGEGKLDRAWKRIEKVAEARRYVAKYQEFQAVGGVPTRAVTVASRSAWTEGAMRFGATHGLRMVGGALIVYGAYSSIQRVREAPKCERNRVATQEVGGWMGGLIGAWSVGKAFAFGGAVLGVETGPGAIVTGLAGGIVGGVVGGIGGALGADWVYSLMHDDSAAETCSIAHDAGPTEIAVP